MSEIARVVRLAHRKSANPRVSAGMPLWVWVYDDGSAVAYYGGSDWRYDSVSDLCADYGMPVDAAVPHYGQTVLYALERAWWRADVDCNGLNDLWCDFELRTDREGAELFAREYVIAALDATDGPELPQDAVDAMVAAALDADHARLRDLVFEHDRGGLYEVDG